MLVDPELASRARELLHEPGENNGKGNMSTLLGTHEISSGTVLGLEPPLSPPVVHGPSAMTTAGPSAHVDLPSPPPALRPPESSMASEPAPTPEPAPAPAPVPAAPAADAAPAQPEQASPPPPPPPPPVPVQQDPEPLMAPPVEPVAPQAPDPEPIELKPVTPAQEPELDVAASALSAAEPEPELPAMAPEPPAAPAEPEATPLAQDDFQAPELVMAPPPPPEPAEPAAPELPALVVQAPVEEAPIELPAVESLAPPAPEPPVAEEPVIEPTVDIPLVASQPGAFRVVVRLSDGEGDGVEVGEFRDFGTAMQGAQEVIDQFSHSNGSWPFYAGRFIRPDLIISVDVVDAD